MNVRSQRLAPALALLTLAGFATGASAQLVQSTVFVSGFTNPVGFVQDPSDPTVQFVVEQGGRIRVVKNRTVQVVDFLDLSGGIAAGGERGLLGLAFPPDYAASGRFFVNFTDTNGNTVIARFLRSANPLVANAASRFDLRWSDGRRYIAQPSSNHNGGHLAFGPDGYLYIGMGDGGSANDPGNRAQDPTTLLGKLLRIDVNVADADPNGYRVPADNPFLDGVPVSARGEIWSFGLRNPWQFSFDDPSKGGTGALVIGDVGQGAWEEIDYEPAGAGGRNYGWRYREGAHDNVTTLPPAYGPLVDPISEYDHATGQSISGGVVYRGGALGSSLRGRYFFGDFISGRVWSVGLDLNPVTHEATAVGLVEHTAALGGPTGLGNVSAFGVDASGEIYIVSYSRGLVLRVDPGPSTSLPVLAASPSILDFGAEIEGGSLSYSTPDQPVLLTQTGTGTVNWTVTADQPWVRISSESGSGTGMFSIGISSSGLPAGGSATATVTVVASGAQLSPQVLVRLALHQPGASSPPFGRVDTPLPGASHVSGSLPVTGWALDDIGVSRVEIFREPVPPEPPGALVYIGDGTLVGGARPDVEAAYPTFPLRSRAGWGYLLLTNALPDHGNGTFTLHVWALGIGGGSTLLGTRTFAGDNANAMRPFGTIDTPGPGATASGSAYPNFGWALTPQPKTIPVDGSSITVFVDGVAVGHSGPLGPRSDIAALFPGLKNTDHAVGFFPLDTTALTNGVHTIAWVASDDQNAADGLGSRYFTVFNSSAATAVSEGPHPAALPEQLATPVRGEDSSAPVFVRRGFDASAPVETVFPSPERRIVARELERMTIGLDGPDAPRSHVRFDGHLQVEHELRPLPVGSTLDRQRGVFAWLPGPGFIGTYDFEFTRAGLDGKVERIALEIVIEPRDRAATAVRMAIDLPSPGAVTQPFLVAGWAIDRAATSGPGIDSVHVWAYPDPGSGKLPVFLGVADYGDERPDVAAAFGSTFARSAFGLTVSGLAPGIYGLAVFPHSRITGQFAAAQVVRVSVR